MRIYLVLLIALALPLVACASTEPSRTPTASPPAAETSTALVPTATLVPPTAEMSTASVPTATFVPPMAETSTALVPTATFVPPTAETSTAFVPTATFLPPTPTPESSGEVEVSGHTLFYRCVGKGAPTIVIEAGLNEPGATSGTWDRVIEQVATTTRVCAYDRANLGRSGAADKPRTSEDIVQDLHALLSSAHIGGPYVLVGHSIGGFHVRVYAAHYPNDVAGIVLVDSSHPDQFARWLAGLPTESPSEGQRLKELREYFTMTPANSAANREGFDILASAAQVRSTGSLGAMPLIVVTRSSKTNPLSLPPDLDAQVEKVWLDLQEELTRLSSNSTQMFAAKAGHNIQRDEPQVVSDAILRMVREARGQERIGSSTPMAFIPAGEFTMGSDDHYADEKPEHIVYLAAYWMDKFEVTNAQHKQ